MMVNVRLLHWAYFIVLQICGFWTALMTVVWQLIFGDLKQILQKTFWNQVLDHHYLNESLPYMNTTAENMVYWIF